MYMGPITAAAPTRPASRPALRAAVGVPVLLLSGAVMLPWLAVNAAVAGIVFGGRALVASPRALVQAIDYAGRVALGR
jgi:hypothetical protein